MKKGDQTQEGRDSHDTNLSGGRQVDVDRAGLKQLANQQKQQMEYLKQGGKSGITGEFGKPILIADNPDRPDKSVPMLKGGLSEDQRFEKLVDQAGVVPFGGKLEAGASASGIHSDSYYSTTIAFDGLIRDARAHRDVQAHQDIVNINIGDKLTIDGHSVFDGKPHIFPIKQSEGNSHWRWVQATLHPQGERVQIDILKMSPSRADKPSADPKDWDQVNISAWLKHLAQPQHVSSREFAHQDSVHFVPYGETPPAWTTNYYKANLHETAREDD